MSAVSNQNRPDQKPTDALIAQHAIDEAEARGKTLSALPELQRAVKGAVVALRGVYGLRTSIPERTARALSDARESIDAVAESAGLKVRTNRNDVLGAEAEARKAAQARVVQRALESFGERAVALGTKASEAMIELDIAIEREKRKAASYLEGGASLPLNAAIAERALASEIEADGLSALHARCESCARTGDTEELDRLLRIAKPFIVKATKEPRAKVAQRLGPNALPDSIEREVESAWKLKNLLDMRTRARMPPEIEIALGIRDQLLRMAFGILCGVNASWMSHSDFSGMLDGRVRVPENWQIDPLWYRREIDSKSWGQ